MWYLAGTLPTEMLLGCGLFQASYLFGFVSLQSSTVLAVPFAACVLSGHDANPQGQWETAISSRDTAGTPGRGEI